MRLSVIIPASNEAALIGRCLRALLASDTDRTGEVVVVANGCRDETAKIARGFEPATQARGWTLQVLERSEGNKLAALNAGDKAITGDARIYLDADVVVSPDLMEQIAKVLDRPDPAYASGRVEIAPSDSWISRAYGRIYQQVPFMTQGVPGCGLFAVNAPGRARWKDFPDIISDDTFVRLSFSPEERVGVPAQYQWPIVEGAKNLLRVRQRQDAGVAEVAELYPQLMANDDKPPFGVGRALRLALRDPVGFAIYATIGLIARKRQAPGPDRWSRGR